MGTWYAKHRAWAIPMAWVLCGWAVWWALVGGPERVRNQAINPQIYPAFRLIEQQCLGETFPHETVRCKTALELMASCAAKDPACRATDYYEDLFVAGFTMPPLYLRPDK